MTVAVLVREGCENFKANFMFSTYIILSQFFGAFLGIVIAYWAQRELSDVLPPDFQVDILCPVNPAGTDNANITYVCHFDNPVDYLRPFLIQLLATFLFVSYQISSIYNQLAPDIVQNAMGTGIAFMALSSVSQGLTGSCLNPYFAVV